MILSQTLGGSRFWFPGEIHVALFDVGRLDACFLKKTGYVIQKICILAPNVEVSKYSKNTEFSDFTVSQFWEEWKIL